MQSGLKGGTVDKELLDFEAGLEQEAGARFQHNFSGSPSCTNPLKLGGWET